MALDKNLFREEFAKAWGNPGLLLFFSQIFSLNVELDSNMDDWDPNELCWPLHDYQLSS